MTLIKMTMGDWEEVKRLAADFQKVQLSSTLEKLSERCCVEIIKMLVDRKLLEVIFTNDGKEYVTPEHLVKEVKNELWAHGGRINMTELTQVLNVNLSHITSAVSELEKHNKNLKVVLGQLIDDTYMTKISEEINEKLIQNGSVNVTDLILQYDLPGEFIQEVIETNLGKLIFAKQDTQDARIFYTDVFIARNKAKIRGAMSACSKPTPLSAVLGQCGVPERIFFSILEELQELKQIPGTVTGKQSGNSIYIPFIYSKCRNEWVDNFYRQNGYLEYDALARFDISDPVTFIKKHFQSNDLVFLNTVAVGTAIIDQVDAYIEEAIITESYVDIYSFLPSVFSFTDAETILKAAVKRSKFNVHIFLVTVAVSDAYLQKLIKSLQSLTDVKVKEVIESGKWLQHIAENKMKGKSDHQLGETKGQKKEERRKKAASGKAGGGSQGRETRTKSTKKKYMQGKTVYDSDEEYSKPASSKNDMEIISVNDVKSKILKEEEATGIEDELAHEIAVFLQEKLNKNALTAAEELAHSSKTTNLSEIEEKLNLLIMNIRIFYKGLKNLEKTEQTLLTKYLLKSLGLDVITEIFKLAAQQNMVQCPQNLTTELRQKLILEMPADMRGPLTNLHKTLSGESIDDFFTAAETAMAACCLVLRKFDKKKEKPLVLAHREALLAELSSTEDPALALHLITSILFIAATKSAVHMSGKHVAAILSFIKVYLVKETMDYLTQYHDLVLNLFSSNEDVKLQATKDLKEGLEKIKDIGTNFKNCISSEPTKSLE
ncbi:E3 UFM1-protein ligase 1 homolog isoform X2 [Prorops nasuta]|uniref:E3 UFM1-protein ligase 1 homolog isoform X2 n=1 Tax=Prorops nasuta TaxID=863751 RepID=UPI0034CDAD5F